MILALSLLSLGLAVFCVWLAYGWVDEAHSHRNEVNATVAELRRELSCVDELRRELEDWRTKRGELPLPRPSQPPAVDSLGRGWLK